MALDGIAGAGAHDGAGDDGERDDGEPAGPRTWTATDPRDPRGPRLAVPAPPASAPAGVPAVLAARYELGALLGRGGMGAVYRATDRQLGRAVAIKLLAAPRGDASTQAGEAGTHTDDAGNADDDDGVLREARAQARVDHPSVCKVFEVGRADGASYIAMQYVAGERFDHLAPRLTIAERVRVLRDIAHALHEAHRLGLVHRDVKPSNILVERDPDGALRPYLTDFGIAREIGAHGTLTGVVAGTPAFMAPEQARGEIRALDRRTNATLAAAGEGDEAGGVLRKRRQGQVLRRFTLGARLHFLPRYQLAQIAIADGVFAQEQQRVAVDAELSAADGTETGLLGRFGKARQTVKTALVGQRQRAVAKLRGARGQLLRLRGPGEEAEGALAAQLDIRNHGRRSLGSGFIGVSHHGTSAAARGRVSRNAHRGTSDRRADHGTGDKFPRR